MTPPSTLCPGFTSVEAFGPDEEYESGEEVCYVTLDLGDVEPKLVPSSNSYRLVGLDTPTPFLQIQGTILAGRHDVLLGTEMLFADKDSHDWNKRSVVHVANTEQRIAFHEVTLTPKVSDKAKGKQRADANEGDDENNQASNGGDEINVNFLPAAAELPATTIERMTGVVGPAVRAPKRPSVKATSKGKGKATKSAKAKGKEKEVVEPTPPSESLPAPMDEDAPGDDDDIYMDE